MEGRIFTESKETLRLHLLPHWSLRDGLCLLAGSGRCYQAAVCVCVSVHAHVRVRVYGVTLSYDTFSRISAVALVVLEGSVWTMNTMEIYICVNL